MKLFIFLIATAGASMLATAEPVAILKHVSGEVLLKRGEDYLSAEKGELIHSLDMLQTGPSSSAGVIFNDGTAVSIGPKSMLNINKYVFKPAKSDYAMDLSLMQGSAAFESGKIGKTAPDKVHFRVPKGSIGIRGTKFVVEVK